MGVRVYALAMPWHADIRVFTFKDGLLARLTHDLRLSAHDAAIDLKGSLVRARFGAGSLRVDGVAHDERIDLAGLSDHDKHKVENTVRDEILQATAFADIRFEGQVSQADDQQRIDGSLELHGIRHALQVAVSRDGDTLVAEASFAPSSFGIAPYKALAGAIRLQDRVVVRLRLHTDGQTSAALLAAADGVHWTAS